ncbi:MAG TPA: flavin reductase family protein [Gemmatimonadales bacterium]|nr:flavin reductase family protein [Gemmatimonadales bacterium]
MHGVDAAQFRQLLGQFATGVTILTTLTPEGRPIGMTASSVASVSLDPPLLLVSVNKQHDMHAALLKAKHFVLNVLSQEQEGLSRRFAADHPDRFSGVGFKESRFGVPVLEGVLANIDCEKLEMVAGGDHTVFFGLVIDGAVSNRSPLLYYRGGYAGLRV